MPALNFRAAITACALLVLTACESSTQAPQVDVGDASSSLATSTQTTMADPLQPRYAATLSEGIDFKRPGYPEFVIGVDGISGPEDWGRWTDTNQAPHARIRFDRALPKDFTLVLRIRDFFGINEGKEITVMAGGEKQVFTLTKDSEQGQTLVFSGVGGDTIELVAPNSSEPTAADGRSMGIGLISLSIQE